MALSGPFTIEAWVLNPANGAFETILTVGTNRDLYLGNGVITFYTGQQDLTFGTALPVGTWTHVALTYTSGVLRAYVNGVQQGPTGSTLANVTAALQVGAWMPSANQDSDFFSGTLDEVRVYGRAHTGRDPERHGHADPDRLTPPQGHQLPVACLPMTVRSLEPRICCLASETRTTVRSTATGRGKQSPVGGACAWRARVDHTPACS